MDSKLEVAEPRRVKQQKIVCRTSKGQTTIPKDVRKRLNLHPGDRLEFVIDDDGRVLLLPATVDVSELAGMLKWTAQPVTVSEMNQVIRKRGGRR